VRRSRAPGTASQSESGFTLIELLIVLALMALLVGLAPGLLPGRARSEVAAAARATAAALRETRSTAIADDRTETFVADVGKGGFRLGNGEIRRWPSSLQVSLVDRAAPEGIRFFPDGSSSGGGVVLRRGVWRYEVSVDWLTGRVSIAETSPTR